MGTLSELIGTKYGKDHKKLADGDVPVYRSGGLMRKTERGLYEGESALIPRKGSLNNVMYADSEFWTVDTLFYSIQRNPGAAKYAYEILTTQDLASMNSGSAVPSMTMTILDALQLRVPSPGALREFDARLASLYKAIEANARACESLSLLRDALLPKVMTGEIGVSEVDILRP